MQILETALPLRLAQVERAIGDLRRGQILIVRAARALLVQAAELAGPDSVARLNALGQSTPCLIVTGRRAAALGLVSAENPAPAVRIRLAGPVSAAALKQWADPALARPTDLAPPIAIEPVDARDVEEAAVELAKLGFLLPSLLAVAVPDSRLAYLGPWAMREELLIVEADEVFAHRRAAAHQLTPVAQARLPLEGAENAQVLAFRPGDGGREHLAVVIGTPAPEAPVLVRLHSECFTGDLLASLRCDCGTQLREAVREIGRAGEGVLLYLAQEGRGIGLVNKLRAYQLQDAGNDTIEANEELGFDADERLYLPAAEMLRHLGFRKIRLMTNNPDKVEALKRFGIEVVERVAHSFPSNGHNERYLQTKARRSGHLL